MISLLRSSLMRMHTQAPGGIVHLKQIVAPSKSEAYCYSRSAELTKKNRNVSTTSSTSAEACLIYKSTASTRRSYRLLIKDFLKLSKHRLSALVAFTAATGYLCRVDENDVEASNGNQCRSRFYRTLVSTTVGTFMTAACANTLNQLYEIRSDALMSRTRLRPLPTGRIGQLMALSFAVVMGTSGLAVLAYDTNRTTTGIAAVNIALYAGVYTPLKAVSTINTWIGAVVGALPPLLGWAAASGGRLMSERESGGWGLAALLFLWQIPHFHALAVALRTDYAAGGLRMLGVSNPFANALWARRTAALLLPIGAVLHSCGVTNDAFVWQSAILSAWMFRASGHLVADPTSPVAARRLFRASICHLPICLVLLIINRVPYSSYTEQSQKAVSSDKPIIHNEVHLHQPWEVIAPFPFLPVPRGAPAIVVDKE